MILIKLTKNNKIEQIKNKIYLFSFIHIHEHRLVKLSTLILIWVNDAKVKKKRKIEEVYQIYINMVEKLTYNITYLFICSFFYLYIYVLMF